MPELDREEAFYLRPSADISRRTVAAGIGSLLLVAGQTSRAEKLAHQPKLGLALSISLADFTGPTPRNRPIRAFLEGLQELGWVDGKSIEILRRAVDGDRTLAPAMIQELVDRRVDVIFLGGTSWLHGIAQNVTSQVPLVAMFAEDPVVSGYAESLSRPGRNLTGITRHAGPELYGKWLELLREVVPGTRNTAFLAPAANLADLQNAALPGGMKITPIRADIPADIEAALSSILRERCDSIMVPAGPLFHTHAERLAEFALRHNLPSLSAIREFAVAGGLISYGPDVEAQFKSAARIVDKILRGMKPAEIPIEQPTEFDMIVNTRTARTLGITIPPSILVRAGEIID